MMKDKDLAYWLADKIPAYGDYAKETARVLRKQADEIECMRETLTGISDELGLPPTMGPAKGELKRLLDQGKDALEKLRGASVAVSSEADFEVLTWTFQIAPDCRIRAGKYALVWMGPNVKGQAADAVLSRQVACTDGLGAL